MPEYETTEPIVSPPRVLELTDLWGTHIIECFNVRTAKFEGYVKAFNPEFRDGRGGIDLTQEIVDALRFKDMGAAFECYRMQSETRPLRPDGKPNRPMTAYTASVTRVA